MKNRGKPRSRERASGSRRLRTIAIASGIVAVIFTAALVARVVRDRAPSAVAQVPPASAPSPIPGAPGSAATALPQPGATASPAVGPGTPGASPSAPSASPAAGEASPAPSPVPYETPTQPPIIVEPPNAGVSPGGTTVLRVMQVLGTISVSVANPALLDVTVDQIERTITVRGKLVGNTTLTVTDSRGLTRDVGIKVALPAGSVADRATVRVTGNPATELFVKEQAIAAAVRAAMVRPGAVILPAVDAVHVEKPLDVDDVMTVKVPIVIQGGDTYFGVIGYTKVRVENYAEPTLSPRSLLVSDFPETLRENGTLFSADISPRAPERLLYFHYNPANQTDRRVVLRITNPSSEPALVQVIAGAAGPEPNEMEVGHLATQRFLVRLAQNEGTVTTIPGHTTISLYDQPLPARNVISGLLQLNEIAGSPLHLTLVAQNAADPIDGTGLLSSQLLVGDHPHARGIYSIPEFFFEYSYDPDGPDLEIPIGQIPLPNLVQGQTLAGDYGVLQRATIRIYNYDQHNARQIALYANPRGGRATGTFIVDRILLQAHAMAPFGHYKLRQYTVGPGTHISIDVITIPEGGSSYPLRLIVAPDDGSAPPGSSDSPIY
jgi:hypothetical protein